MPESVFLMNVVWLEIVHVGIIFTAVGMLP